MMRNDILRTCLWVIGLCALIGNFIVIGYRVLYDRTSLSKGHGIFITSLGTADFLMGIYMLTVEPGTLQIANKNFRQSTIRILKEELLQLLIRKTLSRKKIVQNSFQTLRLIFIVFNFILFLVIAGIQLIIYREVKTTLGQVRSTQKRQDLTIARNLFVITASDYPCDLLKLLFISCYHYFIVDLSEILIA
jgi:hypothetical protein